VPFVQLLREAAEATLIKEFESKWPYNFIVIIIVINIVTELAAIHAKRVTIQQMSQ
jgi:histone H3/H4